MEDLILELKSQIIKVLNLEELTPDDIDAEAPLFGEDEDIVGGIGAHTNHAHHSIVIAVERHTNHTGSCATHGTHLILVEAYGLAIAIGENHLAVTLG